MVNGSYFRFDDDNKIKYTFSGSSQENWVSWRHTAPYSEYKDNWATHQEAIWQSVYEFMIEILRQYHILWGVDYIIFSIKINPVTVNDNNHDEL